MTDREYLWKSHESFLQNYIAIYLFRKLNCYVNVDYSGKNIGKYDTGFDSQKEYSRRRFDLVCWREGPGKRKRTVNSIIEIKTWRPPADVVKDVRKISEYLLSNNSRRCSGHVLYYQDFKRDKKQADATWKRIRSRFESVNSQLESEFSLSIQANLVHGVSDYIFGKKGEIDPWGIALYRLCRKTPQS